MENTQILRKIGFVAFDDVNAAIDGFSNYSALFDYTGGASEFWDEPDNDREIDFTGNEEWEL